MRFPLPLSLCALLTTGCPSTPREAPTCDDTENYACFTGAFRTLLGADVEGIEVCPLDLPDGGAGELGDLHGLAGHPPEGLARGGPDGLHVAGDRRGARTQESCILWERRAR